MPDSNVYFVFVAEHEPVWALNIALIEPAQVTKSFSINELMQEGILWGVPKKRPTIERRLTKRFGVSKYPQTCPILRPRSDIVTCERCGDHHETYTICRTCYLEVKEETEKLKSEIKAQTSPLEPKEKEVFLKFENENTDNAEDELHKFRIIEIDRPRPKWFTPNLLAKNSRPVTPPRDVIINPEDTISSKH